MVFLFVVFTTTEYVQNMKPVHNAQVSYFLHFMQMFQTPKTGLLATRPYKIIHQING